MLGVLAAGVLVACSGPASGQSTAGERGWIHMYPAGCEPAVDTALLTEGESATEIDPLGSGQPLAGRATLGMETTDLATILRKLALCHTYRYEVRVDTRSGFSELWCTPPPGTVDDILYSRGSIVVFVVAPGLQTPRPQPEQGWGCDATASPTAT